MDCPKYDCFIDYYYDDCSCRIGVRGNHVKRRLIMRDIMERGPVERF